MLKKLKCLILGVLGFSAISPGLEATPITIWSEPGQRIKAWGFTPGPIDWDGRSMLRNRELMSRIYQESGASMVRLVIGTGGLFWEEKGGLNPERTKALLFPQIFALRDAGIKEYMISMIVPPSVLRKYRSDESYVELDRNELREEREDEYIKYLVDIVDLIAKEKLPLPRAISVQSQPDKPAKGYFGSTAFPGCPYSPAQWIRVVSKLRAALDRMDFKNVGIVGPETHGKDWLSAAFEKSAETAGANTSLLDYLAGVAFNSVGSKTEEGLNGDVRFRRHLGAAREVGRDIWITGINLETATTDQEILLETFVGMQRDLVEYGASHWFWRYAFAWDSGAEVLIYGRASTETPVYAALKKLWKTSPVGSVVYGLGAIHAKELSPELCGFALVADLQTTVVLVNNDAKDVTFEFPGIQARNVSQHTYTGNSNPTEVSLQASAGVWRSKTPAKTVSIIVFSP